MTVDSWGLENPDEEEVFGPREVECKPYVVTASELQDPLRLIKLELSSLLLSNQEPLTAYALTKRYFEDFDTPLIPNKYGFATVPLLLDAIKDKVQKYVDSQGQYVYTAVVNERNEDIGRLVRRQKTAAQIAAEKRRNQKLYRGRGNRGRSSGNSYGAAFRLSGRGRGRGVPYSSESEYPMLQSSPIQAIGGPRSVERCQIICNLVRHSGEPTPSGYRMTINNLAAIYRKELGLPLWGKVMTIDEYAESMGEEAYQEHWSITKDKNNLYLEVADESTDGILSKTGLNHHGGDSVAMTQNVSVPTAVTNRQSSLDIVGVRTVQRHLFDTLKSNARRGDRPCDRPPESRSDLRQRALDSEPMMRKEGQTSVINESVPSASSLRAAFGTSTSSRPITPPNDISRDSDTPSLSEKLIKLATNGLNQSSNSIGLKNEGKSFEKEVSSEPEIRNVEQQEATTTCQSTTVKAVTPTIRRFGMKPLPPGVYTRTDMMSLCRYQYVSHEMMSSIRRNNIHRITPEEANSFRKTVARTRSKVNHPRQRQNYPVPNSQLQSNLNKNILSSPDLPVSSNTSINSDPDSPFSTSSKLEMDETELKDLIKPLATGQSAFLQKLDGDQRNNRNEDSSVDNAALGSSLGGIGSTSSLQGGIVIGEIPPIPGNNQGVSNRLRATGYTLPGPPPLLQNPVDDHNQLQPPPQDPQLVINHHQLRSQSELQNDNGNVESEDEHYSLDYARKLVIEVMGNVFQKFPSGVGGRIALSALSLIDKRFIDFNSHVFKIEVDAPGEEEVVLVRRAAMNDVDISKTDNLRDVVEADLLWMVESKTIVPNGESFQWCHVSAFIPPRCLLLCVDPQREEGEIERWVEIAERLRMYFDEHPPEGNVSVKPGLECVMRTNNNEYLRVVVLGKAKGCSPTEVRVAALDYEAVANADKNWLYAIPSEFNTMQIAANTFLARIRGIHSVPVAHQAEVASMFVSPDDEQSPLTGCAIFGFDPESRRYVADIAMDSWTSEDILEKKLARPLETDPLPPPKAEISEYTRMRLCQESGRHGGDDIQYEAESAPPHHQLGAVNEEIAEIIKQTSEIELEKPSIDPSANRIVINNHSPLKSSSNDHHHEAEDGDKALPVGNIPTFHEDCNIFIEKVENELNQEKNALRKHMLRTLHSILEGIISSSAE